MNLRKNPRYYPIYLNIEGLKCLVVGGGPVAERKVESLLKAGARVTVVSPDLTDRLSKLVKKGQVRHLPALYRTSHMKGMRLAIGATNNTPVNTRIFKDAERLGIVSNIVDVPALCRFIVPAVLKEGDISIAICTGGAAPVVSKVLKKDLGSGFLKKYARLASKVKRVRERAKTLPKAEKKAFWERLIEQWKNGR